MFCQQSTPQAGQVLQFQLTSHMGGSSMVESIPNDASYGHFEADVDNALGIPTQSTHGNSPLVHPGPYAAALDSHPISNGQSPQLSPELAFTPGLGRTVASSDWLQHQTSAANNPSLIFSSSSQSHNPGQNQYPHSAVQTQMTEYDASRQPYECGDGECQPVPLYSGHQFPTQRFGNSFQNIPVTLPYNSLGQPQAYSISQPVSGTHSGYSSNGSTPTATCSSAKDMVPDIFHSASDAHEGRCSVGSSEFCLPYDVQLSSDLETTNSYYSPETDTLSCFEPTDGQLQVSSADTSRSRRYTTSHHGTLDNTTQHVALRRSFSTRPPNRRSSIGIAHLQPKPQKSVAGDAQKSSFSMRDIHMPKKGRGRRTKPLEEGKRKAATRRRNERTVCIGCKLAKVICEGREHGGNCDRCTSSQNSAPKPFVCVPASFIELIQQGSTMLLALCVIYSGSSVGLGQAIRLPFDIDVRQLLGSISALQTCYSAIRAYQGSNMLFELDLQGCWTFITANYSPTTHPFRQFIDGLKFQRQGHWKACIKNSTQALASLCETLFTWDDAAPCVTYSMVYEVSRGAEGHIDLDPNDEQHTQIVFVAAQLYRIIGRQLELQFYDHLKKAIGSPNICHGVVLEVGRAIISLRRRLASWAQHRGQNRLSYPPEIECCTDEDNDDHSYPLWDGSIVADRIRKICLILYVYFCYMRRRLPLDEQGDLHTMEVWDPDNDRMEQVRLPQYESIKGFEDWLQFVIN